MTYKTDPRRKAAARWHALLNNGIHYVLQDSNGKTHAQGASQHAPAITQGRRLRPDLILIRVDDQI